MSVVIPVGPKKEYLEWLPECIQSVLHQTHKPNEIIFVDDGANLTYNQLEDYLGYYLFKTNEDRQPAVTVHKTLWNVGVADAFNFGVALASNDLVFMLGSDDKLMPDCLAECVKAWESNGKKDAWYGVTVQYQNGEIQWISCNAAMVTKGLWKWTGGFPPSAGVGACDALLLSILIKHAPDKIVHVKQGLPLCWLRDHPFQDTKYNAWTFNPEIISIRNKETDRWKPKF